MEPVYFTTQVPDTSNTSATRAKPVQQKRHEHDTNDTIVTQVRNFNFDNDRVKTFFPTPILAIWQIKNYKERNNSFLRTTFWKCIVPCQNAFEKCTTKS